MPKNILRVMAQDVNCLLFNKSWITKEYHRESKERQSKERESKEAYV